MAISVNNLLFQNGTKNESKIKNRLKSSVYAKSSNYEKVFRPKSSPIKLNPEGLESFYLGKRSQTAPQFDENSMLNLCERSIKSRQEPVKMYRFPSAPEKRHLQAENNNNTNRTKEELMRIYNLGPGYVIRRNDSEFTIRIDSDEFFGKKKQFERKEATNANIQDHKDVMISQLEEQISNLTVFLEEEKINHNLSLMKCQEQLESTRNTITENYTKQIQNIRETHENLLKEIEIKHNESSVSQRKELEEKLNKSQQELQTFQASFDSYRQALIKESENKIEMEKERLLDCCNRDLSDKLDKQKKELKCNFEVDIESIKQEHSCEIEKLKSNHKTEIDILNRRFADAVAVEDKLSKTLQEVEKRKRDYQKLQGEYENLHQAYSKIRRELTMSFNENENLKSEIQEFSERFDERVKRVDDDYKQRIDSLQNQIVEMRRAYMAKCEELVNERKEADKQLHGKIESAKDVMKEIIHTRQRARISLVSLESDSETEEFWKTRNKTEEAKSFLSSFGRLRNDSHKVPADTNNSDVFIRPISAPTTEMDEKNVKMQSFLLNKDIL